MEWSTVHVPSRLDAAVALAAGAGDWAATPAMEPTSRATDSVAMVALRRDAVRVMASAILSEEGLEFHGHLVCQGDDALRGRSLHAEVLPREGQGSGDADDVLGEARGERHLDAV